MGGLLDKLFGSKDAKLSELEGRFKREPAATAEVLPIIKYALDGLEKLAEDYQKGVPQMKKAEEYMNIMLDREFLIPGCTQEIDHFARIYKKLKKEDKLIEVQSKIYQIIRDWPDEKKKEIEVLDRKQIFKWYFKFCEDYNLKPGIEKEMITASPHYKDTFSEEKPKIDVKQLAQDLKKLQGGFTPENLHTSLNH